MAQNDIQPWTSPLGGSAETRKYRLNASETFVKGEPVGVNADGELTESADDAAAEDIIGVAAGPVSYTRNGTTVTTNPETGVDFTTGDMVPVYLNRPGQTWITSNFDDTTGGFGDTPTAAHIGDECGLQLQGGDWGIHLGGSEQTCRIVDVLDDNFESIQRSGNTGVYVVFEIIDDAFRNVAAPLA